MYRSFTFSPNLQCLVPALFSCANISNAGPVIEMVLYVSFGGFIGHYHSDIFDWFCLLKDFGIAVLTFLSR